MHSPSRRPAAWSSRTRSRVWRPPARRDFAAPCCPPPTARIRWPAATWSGRISSAGVRTSCPGPMTDLDLTIERERLDAVRRGAAVVVDHPTVFRITGPGALTCLQGLFTNDLDHPGDGSLLYGAMLTPKGMIVVDAWIIRQPGALTLIAPAEGRDAVREIFQRTLPPRLAKAQDLTGETAVAWVLGAHGFHTLMQSGIAAPEAAGRVVEHESGAGPLTVALGPESAPFAAFLTGTDAA